MGEQEFFEQADRTQAAVQRHFLNGVASVLEQNRTEHADVPPLAETLEEIAALLQRFMNLPNPALAMLLAVWISGTYLFERFQYCGYIALRSATPRCGKSRLLKIMSKLMADTPPVTISPTAAVLFRSSRKTLILDEVDKLRNKVDLSLFNNQAAAPLDGDLR